MASQATSSAPSKPTTTIASIPEVSFTNYPLSLLFIPHILAF
jgi:hypothetical protein